mmetsp:Transcript_72832/g.236611  ORF Transcript_72832/g.236611 Transcript_72832/m.236611 type:complete len:491 (+) Transcript_72832:60-1532(+)
MQAGPTFTAVLYAAVTIGLGTLSLYGVPGTSQGLGSLVFLSAFPLLFLNERRYVRMVHLLQQTVQKATSVEGLSPENEGRLVMVVGQLQMMGLQKLTIPAWGVNAPQSSAGVRVQVEQLQPVQRCSAHRLLCQHSEWRESEHGARSSEAKASHVQLGGFMLGESAMRAVDAWVPFVPLNTERFRHVLTGFAGGVAHAFRFADPLPFPDERPQVLDSGSVLYYQRAGTGKRPAIGDVKVRFLQLPCGPAFLYTAIGVQRGDTLQPFQYRDMPPSGLALGESHFNTDDEAYYGVPVQDQHHMSKQFIQTEDSGGETTTHTEEDSSARWRFCLVAGSLSASMEVWRRFLHLAAPEAMREVVPGAQSRCGYALRVYFAEASLTWRIRMFGFLLMVAGLEIALWKWEFALSLLGGVGGFAIWAFALIGAGGFTACTVAAASVYYHPVSALLTIVAGVALFSVLFGTMTLVMALLVVGGCMSLVGVLMMAHLLLPC